MFFRCKQSDEFVDFDKKMETNMRAELEQYVVSMCVVRSKLPREMVIFHEQLLEHNGFSVEKVKALPQENMIEAVGVIFSADPRSRT